MTKRGKRKEFDPSKLNQQFGFKINPSDFGNDEEKTRRFLEKLHEEENISDFIKTSIIDRLRYKVTNQEEEYVELLDYLKINRITFKEALIKLKNQKNEEEIDYLVNKVIEKLQMTGGFTFQQTNSPLSQPQEDDDDDLVDLDDLPE